MVPTSRGVCTPAGPPIVAVHPGLLPGPLYLDGSSGRWLSCGRPRPVAGDSPESDPACLVLAPPSVGAVLPTKPVAPAVSNYESDARRTPRISPGVPWEGIVVRSPLPPSSLPSGSDARGNRMPPPSSPLAPPLRWGGNRPICFSGTSARRPRLPALASGDFWSLPLWGGCPSSTRCRPGGAAAPLRSSPL